MGIKGLHGKIADSCQPVHLREFAGQVAGIDGFCWLYAAKSVAEKEDKDQTATFKDYLRRKLQLFVDHGVKPVLVLDGRRLLAKAEEHAKRAAKRKSSGKLVKSSLVGPSAALRFIEIAREMKIDVIVSPYESDAQLAYLSACKMVDFVVTEDGDLLMYGCQRVLFKLGWNAVGKYFEFGELADCFKMRKEDFNLDKLHHIGILSGCDYVENVRNFGIVNAIRAVKKYPSGGIEEYLVQIEKKVGKDDIPKNYQQKFLEAEFVFNHQLVFDVSSRKIVPFSKYPDPMPFDDIAFAGEKMNDVLGLELSLGNLDPYSLCQHDIGYFDINTVDDNSIWADGYFTDSAVQTVSVSQILAVQDDETKWDCHCGLKFDEPGKLKTHLMSHKRTRTCSICGYVAADQSKLAIHVRIHTGERPFVCQTPGCGAAFAQKSALKPHQLIHNEERNFACQAENCKATFKTPYGLNKHKLIHSDERRFVCEEEGCTAAFKTSSHLVHHKFRHSGRRPYACDFPGCVATFQIKYSLDQHKAFHGEERPYSCPFPGCTKKFKIRQNLNAHKLTHSTEARPFVCEHCGQRFAQADILKKHSAIHSTEKRPFKCKKCGKRFTHDIYLKRHMITHSSKPPQFPCTSCGKIFRYASGLKIHIESHSAEPPQFPCTSCGKVFAFRGSLQRHTKKAHPDIP